MNKSGPRTEACGATDSIFSHEPQKEFVIPFRFLSVVLYGLATCSKATFPCLTVKGKEIAGMGIRNFFKFLKEEESFFKSNSCKSGK